MVRTLKHAWQCLIRGFSDRETGNLDIGMARRLLPRLRRFKEVTNGYPNELTEKQWDGELHEMILALGDHLAQWDGRSIRSVPCLPPVRQPAPNCACSRRHG